MTTTTTPRTDPNGQQRKTLASQIDRLDGILDGLDAALAGAVQDAVEQAVKQAVQSVLTEVLTNRELQQQLQKAAHPTPTPEQPCGKKSTVGRFWQATIDGVRRAVRTVKKAGQGIGVALLAVGGVVATVAYAARKKIVAAASAVCRHGRALLGKTGNVLARLLPRFAFCGT
jgi:hypothetical protein